MASIRSKFRRKTRRKCGKKRLKYKASERRCVEGPTEMIFPERIIGNNNFFKYNDWKINP